MSKDKKKSDAQKLVDAGVKEMETNKHGIPMPIAVPLLAKLGSLVLQLDAVQRQLGDQIRRNYELERELAAAQVVAKAWEVDENGVRKPLDPEAFEADRTSAAEEAMPPSDDDQPARLP